MIDTFGAVGEEGYGVELEGIVGEKVVQGGIAAVAGVGFFQVLQAVGKQVGDGDNLALGVGVPVELRAEISTDNGDAHGGIDLTESGGGSSGGLVGVGGLLCWSGCLG